MVKKARKINQDPPRDQFSIGHETGSATAQASKPPKTHDAYTRNRVKSPVHDPEKHGPSMVQQHFKEEVDINNIVLKYTQTGQISHFMNGKPQYGDVPDGADFTDAMNLITDAQSQFDDLPSEIRAHFQNDPRLFLDAVADQDRAEEMREIGLFPPEQPAPPPVKVEMVNPSSPPEPSQSLTGD